MSSLDIYSNFINTISLWLLNILKEAYNSLPNRSGNAKNNGFICPNAACRKVFAKPLKALNLLLNSKDFYNACPYCLTEIATKDEKDNEPSIKEKVETLEKPPACPYHLGYLSERSAKDTLPDACIVCTGIIQCMLKSLKR